MCRNSTLIVLISFGVFDFAYTIKEVVSKNNCFISNKITLCFKLLLPNFFNKKRKIILKKTSHIWFFHLKKTFLMKET